MVTRREPLAGTQPRSSVTAAARELASRHALLLIVALAAVLRFATLGTPAYWFDESLTVKETGETLGSLFHQIRAVEVNPPLYFVLAWLWRRVLGEGEIALRSLSATLGTATVPVVYAAARELASRRAGLVAAALAATNPLLIWYSQDARAYALLIFGSALTFMFFAYSLRREEPRWLWGWALSCAALLATHYFAAAVVAPQAAWLLLRARAARTSVVLACLGVGAAGAALLPLYIAQHDHPVPPGGWIAFLPRSDRLLAVPQHFVVGLSVPWVAVSPVIGVALLACVAYALVRGDRRSRQGFALAAGLGVAGSLLALAPLLFGNDYIITRNVIELWLPFGIAVAIALGTRRLRVFSAAVTVGLCVAGVALSIWNAATPAAGRVDWRAVAQALGPATQERVVGAPGFLEGAPLSLYLPDSHLAQPEGRIAARELVLLWLRPVPNYGIGPCFWGADCGGRALGPSGPPFGPPRGFKLVRQGGTPRVVYRVYRAGRPVRLPVPTQPSQRNIVVQRPSG